MKMTRNRAIKIRDDAVVQYNKNRIYVEQNLEKLSTAELSEMAKEQDRLYMLKVGEDESIAGALAQ